MSNKFYLNRYPTDTGPRPVLVPRKDVSWESVAVFNPGVIVDKAVIRMLYRTYPSTTKECDKKSHRQGCDLAGQVSSIGYAESTNGVDFERRETPFISPDMPYDQFGCEDPRISKIGDTFYITYTAIDGPLGKGYEESNIRIALASTKDFKTVTKHGIIGPATTSKAAAFFPELVNGGKIGLIMTISSDSSNSHVAVRYFDSMDEVLRQTADSWQDFLKSSKDSAALKTQWWLHRGPELGAPPVKTDMGWLLIYSPEAMGHVWTIGAALLDINEPHKLVARTPGSILQPVANYEIEGLVPQVTFPSGAIIKDDDLYVYYGAADTVIGLATCRLKDILDHLMQFQNK